MDVAKDHTTLVTVKQADDLIIGGGGIYGGRIPTSSIVVLQGFRSGGSVPANRGCMSNLPFRGFDANGPMESIISNVFVLARQRATFDTIMSGFQSGLTMDQMDKYWPIIFARANSFFPVGGVSGIIRQTTLRSKEYFDIPSNVQHRVTGHVTSDFLKASYAAYAVMNIGLCGGRSGPLDATLGDAARDPETSFLQLLTNGPSRAAPGYIGARERILQKWPGMAKRLILAGFPWSPLDAVTKEIAEAMWNPAIEKAVERKKIADALAETQQEQVAKIASQKAALAKQQIALEAAMAAQKAIASENPSSTITDGLAGGQQSAGAGNPPVTKVAAGKGTQFNIMLAVAAAMAVMVFLGRR